MRKRTIGNLITLFLTIVLFLVLLELFIRFYYGTQLKYDIDEELYWTLKPDTVGFLDRALPPITINSEGFRGMEFNSSACKVLVMGDSFTFGSGVHDYETYAHVLDSLLSSNTEVINAGVPGWGLFQIHGLFQSIYPLHKPDEVILLFPHFDLYRVPFDNETEKQAFLRKLRIVNRLPSWETKSFVLHALKNPFLFHILQPPHIAQDRNKTLETLWEEQYHYIKNISDTTFQENRTFLLVLYPQINKTQEKEFTHMVRASLPSVRVISDLDVLFDEHEPQSLVVSEEDDHPSALAHRLIAERIHQELSVCS